MCTKMTEPLKRWPNSFTVRLLEFYEQHPILWNSKHPKYYNKCYRNAALEAIAKEMSKIVPDINGPLVLAKIRSIKNSYVILYEKKLLKKKMSNYNTSWFKVANRFLQHIVPSRIRQLELECRKLSESDHIAKIANDADSNEAESAEGCFEDAEAPNSNENDIEMKSEDYPTINNQDNLGEDNLLENLGLFNELEFFQKNDTSKLGLLNKDSLNDSSNNNYSENEETANSVYVDTIFQKLNESSESLINEIEIYAKIITTQLRMVPKELLLHCVYNIINFLNERTATQNTNEPYDICSNDSTYPTKTETVDSTTLL